MITKTKSMIRTIWFILIGLVALTTAGCVLGPPTIDGDRLVQPYPFELRVFLARKSGQAARYRLDRTGEFHFAGGADALVSNLEAVGKLNDKQRMQLWHLVMDHQLLDAPGVLLVRPQKVRFNVEITAGHAKHAFNTIDDRVPGLDELVVLLADFRKATLADEVNNTLR